MDLDSPRLGKLPVPPERWARAQGPTRVVCGRCRPGLCSELSESLPTIGQSLPDYGRVRYSFNHCFTDGSAPSTALYPFASQVSCYSHRMRSGLRARLIRLGLIGLALTALAYGCAYRGRSQTYLPPWVSEDKLQKVKARRRSEAIREANNWALFLGTPSALLVVVGLLVPSKRRREVELS